MPSDAKLVVRVGAGRITAETADNEVFAPLVSEPLSLRTIDGFKQWLDEKVPRLRARGDFELFGWHLYEFLFRGEIATAFQVEHQQATRDRVPLRLELYIDPAEATLASVPWEFLYCPPKGARKNGFFMSTHTSLSLLRTNAASRTSESIAIDGAPRILMITTRPPGFDLVLWRGIAEAATAELSAKVQGAEVRVVIDPPDLATVRAALGWAPHILQFIGHGAQNGSEGRLALLRSAPYWVTGTELLEALDPLEPGARPRLILLHACEGARVAEQELAIKFGFGGVAPVLLAGNIPAVVAMQYEIDQLSAIDFSLMLYKELLANSAIQQVVQSARAALMTPKLREDGGEPLPRPPRAFGTPVLYMSGTDGVLFPRPRGVEATRHQIMKEAVTAAPVDDAAERDRALPRVDGAPFNAMGLASPPPKPGGS